MKKIILIVALYLSTTSQMLFAQLPSYVPSNGLSGWWSFNGNANDQSGNNLNGTVTGATLTSDRNGNQNSAYSFTTNQDITIPNTSNLNSYPLTISLWYNVATLAATGENSNIFSKYVSSSWNGFHIFLFDARNVNTGNTQYNDGYSVVPWYIRDTSNRVLGYYGETPFLQPNIQTNTWYHFVFTLDSSGGKIYVNNQLVDSHPWTGTPGASTNNYLWKIGGLYDTWFKGKIDDVGVWNRALTSTEIQQLYTGGCTTIAPTGSSTQTFCETSTVANLTATGTAIKWYASATGGTALASTTPLVNGTTYYASQTLNGCESTSRFAVKVILNLSTLTASSTTICKGETVQITATNNLNSSFNWSTGQSEFNNTVELVGQFSHISRSNIENTFNVIAGDRYRLDISGNVSYGGGAGNQRDVAFYTATGSDGTIEGTALTSFCKSGSSSQLTGIYTSLFCDTPGLRPTPNIYDPVNHLYKYPFTAQSTRLTVGFWDDPLGDNGSNTINFKLYKILNNTSSITVTPTQTTDYWVDVTVNGVTCRKSITITVNNNNTPAPTGERLQTFCAPKTVANLVATGTEIKWYTTPTGGTALTSATALVNPPFYYASQTLNVCESLTRLPVTVLLITTLAPTGVSTQTFCETSTVANLTATGTAIKWYAAATGGTALVSTTPLVNGTTYYASQTLNGCESTSRFAVKVILNLSTLTASSTTICKGESVQITATNNLNSSFNWSTGQSEFNNTVELVGQFSHISRSNIENTFNIIAGDRYRLDISGNVSYGGGAGNQRDVAFYTATGSDGTIEGTALTSFCKSGSSSQLTGIYTSLFCDTPGLRPTPNIYDPVNHLYKYPFTAQSTRLTVGFWDDPLGDNGSNTINFKLYKILNNTSSITVTPTQTTDYWVDVIVNGVTCRKSITITVNSTPTPTGATAQTFCAPKTVANLVATGTAIKWYTAATGGTALATTTVLVSGTYYASQTVNGCESQTRLAVTVTVNATSAPTGVSPQTLCEASTVANLTATGAGIKWYAAATGGNALASTTALVNGTTYYASQTVNSCESQTRLAVNTIINAATLSAANTTICSGQSTNLSISNSSSSLIQFQSMNPDLVLFKTIGSHSYFYKNEAISWEQAKAYGDQKGVSLYIINDEIEESLVFNSLPFKGNDGIQYWIGLYQDIGDINYSEPSGGWKWVDNSPLVYTNWYPGEPNNYFTGEKYGQIDWTNYGNKWNDADTNSSTNSCACNLSYPIYELDHSITYLWSTGATTDTINVSPTQTTTYWVDVTTNGVTCRKSIAIAVNPKPEVPTQTLTACNGVPFTFSPVNATPTTATVVPQGTTYTWTVASNPNVTGEANSSLSGKSSISQTLINTTTTTQTVVYTVTPTSGAGCQGAPFTLSITLAAIIPAPSAEIIQTFCTGAAISDLKATGSTGATIKWYLNYTGGTSLSPNESLNNGSIYYASQIVNGCESLLRTGIIVGLNNPVITPPSASVCEGTNVTLASSTPIVLGVNNSVLATILQNGLVGYWPFNNNANDLSGNGINGTVNGAKLASDRYGNPNSAYLFDGIENTINQTNSFFGGNQVSSFSFGALFNVSDTSNSPNIWGKTKFWGEVNLIIHNDNSIEFFWANNVTGNKYSSVRSIPNSIKLNTWNNVVVVFENSILKIYNNGTLVESNMKWSAQGGTILSTTRVEQYCNFAQDAGSNRFGIRNTGGSWGNFFKGTIDDVAIWNRALSPIEIQGLYAMTNTDYTWSTGAKTATISVSPVQTTTYWVDVTTYGVTCRKEVTVNIVNPPPTGNASQAFLPGDTIANLNVTGTNIKWYTSATGGSALPSNTPLINGLVYYASQTVNGCESSTRFGVTVTIFSLPFDNFSITTKSETCSGKNNGEISINAKQIHQYVAKINGTIYAFVNNALTVPNLSPGVYSLCISVEGKIFQQCFTISISKGGTLTGKSTFSSNKALVEITEGTAPFEVLVNGIPQFETNDTNFSVDVRQGDLLVVKTSIACEGIYSQNILEGLDQVIAHPNPTSGIFEITIPTSKENVEVELYTTNAQLISKKNYKVNNHRVQLSLENQSEGVYIAKVNLDIPVSLTIIKKL